MARSLLSPRLFIFRSLVGFKGVEITGWRAIRLSRNLGSFVRLSDVPRHASKTDAADQAAHDVLVSLYPAFQATLDTELQQDLAQITDEKPKADGIAV